MKEKKFYDDKNTEHKESYVPDEVLLNALSAGSNLGINAHVSERSPIARVTTVMTRGVEYILDKAGPNANKVLLKFLGVDQNT